MQSASRDLSNNCTLPPSDIVSGLRDLCLSEDITAGENNNNEVRKQEKCLGCSKNITLTKKGIPHGNHLRTNSTCRVAYQTQQEAIVILGVENLSLTDDLAQKNLCINIRNDWSLMNLVYHYENGFESYEDQIGLGENCNKSSETQNVNTTTPIRQKPAQNEKDIQNKDICDGCKTEITFSKQGTPHGKHLNANEICRNHYKEKSISSDGKIKVCNVVGSSKDKPRNATSWKNFWIQSSGKNWPTSCPICSRTQIRMLGGHMYVKGENAGTEEFILPICSKYCNNNRKIDYNSKYPGRTEWVEIQLTNEISLERVPREAITNFSLRM